MSVSRHLVTEVKDEEVVRKVYLQKKHFQQVLDDIPDENEQSTSNWESSVSSAVSGPTRRMTWSDVDVITKAFWAYDKCPPKKEIHALFESVDDLIEIAEGNTMTRCYEKVKTIFRPRINGVHWAPNSGLLCLSCCVSAKLMLKFTVVAFEKENTQKKVDII